MRILVTRLSRRALEAMTTAATLESSYSSVGVETGWSVRKTEEEQAGDSLDLGSRDHRVRRAARLGVPREAERPWCCLLGLVGASGTWGR